MGDARTAQVTLISILQGVALALLLEGQETSIHELVVGNSIEWTSICLALLVLLIIAASTYVLLIEVLVFSWGFPPHQVLFWFAFASMEWLAATTTGEPAATFAFVAALGLIASIAFIFNYEQTKGPGGRHHLYTSTNSATQMLRKLPLLNRRVNDGVSDRHLFIALLLLILTSFSSFFAAMALVIQLSLTVFLGAPVLAAFTLLIVSVAGTIDFQALADYRKHKMAEEQNALALKVAAAIAARASGGPAGNFAGESPGTTNG